MGGKRDADIIQAFERADGSCADCNDLAEILHHPFDGAAAYGDIFGMHLVPFYRFALDRFECPGPDMQRQFFTAETFGIQVGQYFRCEMKSGCRCGNRTFYLGVNGLISL